MSDEAIAGTVERILRELPAGVTLVAAAKGRTVEEVRTAIRAGVRHVGHNYVQEAAQMIPGVPESVQWHLIGHLQSNKVKLALPLFDLLETVDSWALAQALERRCAALDKVLLVLIEVNSGREPNKSGTLPENVEELVQQISSLAHVHLQGLMTMGPRFGDPEDARPFFRTTRALFERLAQTQRPNVVMRYLSMGMSNSYRVAIEEGANMVRIGTALFGERPSIAQQASQH